MIEQLFPDREKLFTNKVVVVTGGGGGIGWGICLEFAREGARVAVIDKNSKKGQETVAELLEIRPGHHFYEQDIKKTESFGRLVERIEKEVGTIDILINNAGINTEHSFIKMTPEAFDEVYETNLKGHFFLAQTVARRMVANKTKGVILFTSSVHQEVVQGYPHYSSSKAAIAMLVKELAVELAPHGIRDLAVAPGGIFIGKKTEGPQEANDEPTVLLGGKNGIPRDIGRAMVMLASDYWSRHITGEILTVSGGQYLSLVKR